MRWVRRREVRELRKANEVLKLARTCFAQAEGGQLIQVWLRLEIKGDDPREQRRYAAESFTSVKTASVQA